MAQAGNLKRDLTVQECLWSKEDLKKGKLVYRFTHITYGVVKPGMVAVSLEPGEYPFFVVPNDSVEWSTKPIMFGP